MDSELIANLKPLPIILDWQPKDDITVFELEMCLPLIRASFIMPHEIDKSNVWMRHFKIIDNNV